jgi:hypothetical protein
MNQEMLTIITELIAKQENQKLRNMRYGYRTPMCIDDSELCHVIDSYFDMMSCIDVRLESLAIDKAAHEDTEEVSVKLNFDGKNCIFKVSAIVEVRTTVEHGDGYYSPTVQYFTKTNVLSKKIELIYEECYKHKKTIP